MFDSTQNEIQEAILDQSLFMLNSVKWKAFEAKLNEPSQRNEKLANLLNKEAPWE
jgi:uncharacterized protein (DUF1778 family)